MSREQDWGAERIAFGTRPQRELRVPLQNDESGNAVSVRWLAAWFAVVAVAPFGALSGCDHAELSVDAGVDDVDTGVGVEPHGSPDPDWPPLLELEAPSFVESEAGGLAVPSTDGHSSLVVHEGALYLERISGERVLLLGEAELAVGDRVLNLDAAEQPEFMGRRAVFDLGSGIEEWYDPVVGGVEQGWTLSARPAGGEENGELEVRLAVGEEVDATQLSPGVIALRVGMDAVDYSTLIATDAEGTVLPSTMTLVDGKVVLEVDDSEAVYPVTIDPLAVMSSYFLHPAVGNRDPEYGYDVAVYGNVAVVGEPDEASASGVVRGAVHVFRRGTNNAWVAERRIRMGLPPAGTAITRFGAAVDVWGDQLVIGAPAEWYNRGAAYAVHLQDTFDSSGRPTYWTRLLSPTPSTVEQFGSSVGVSNRRIIVGSGAFSPTAYTWYLNLVWAREASFPATGATTYGIDVDIDPKDMKLVVVGAPGGASGTGQVYVYHQTGCCWPPTAAVLPAPSDGTRFGSSVAAYGGRVAAAGLFVGGTRAELRIATGSGSSWSSSPFVYSSGSLTTDPAYSYAYGAPDRQPSVAIAGDVEMLAFPNAYPPGAPSTNREGTVNTPDVTGLSQTNYTGTTQRSRGRSVAMDESAALIAFDYNGFGAVYAYNIRLTNGSVCSSATECTSGYCVDGRCCNNACGGGSTSDCMACSTSAGGTAQGTCTALSAAMAPTVLCRGASGACDVADYCSSTSTACPHKYAAPTTVCRAATQPCQQDARCTGSSAGCPSNAAKPSGTLCGTIEGPCDAQDYCNGSSFACPPSVKPGGTPCGTITGACDAQDYCDGSSVTCPDSYVPVGTVCGAASEPCEVAAVCTGSSPVCPANTPAPAGTACGPAPAGPCDLPDECDGSSFACPALFVAAGTVCLPADGECDAPDKCTGSSPECPATFLSGNTCRPAADDCDIAEQCSGAAADCPPDETIPMCVPEICGNGIDDDLDGDVDCFDDDCAAHPTCGSTELSCSDGIDNDADGLVDCADVDECPTGSECSAGGDEICVATACVPRRCGDGFREHPGTTEWPREACDDGNTDPNDACSETCEPTRVAVWSAASSESSPGGAPSIAADGSGTLLVVFTEDVGSTRSVMARRFSAIGAALDSSPLELDADVGLGWDAQPTVAGSASGGWLVVWTDPNVDGDGAGIATRRVMANGTLGPVVVANSTRLGTQREGRVVGLNSGYAVVWTDESGLDGPLGESLLQARRFDHAGTPVGSDWVITETGRVASQPALTASGDRWVAAWTDAPAWTSGGSSIAARRFGGGAGDDAAPFVASPSDGAEPALAILESGAFALAWVQRSSDPLGDIAARILAPSGDALAGGSVSVLTGRDGEGRPYAQGAPSVTGRTGSDFVVAYEDGGRRRGVRFATVGSVLPEESSTLEQLLLNGFQGDVSLLAAPTGTWFVWSDARDPAAYRSVLAYLLPLN